MLEVKSKFVGAVIAGGLLLSSAAPALASSVHIVGAAETESNVSTNQRSNNSWVFDNGFDDFFSGFFNRKFKANLDGAQEVPGPGDIDGVGEAKIKIKNNQVCADIEVDYIDRATGSHIHHAPKGSTGAIVVQLPVPDEEGEAEGCVDVETSLIEKIRTNPQDYYVNIHNGPYPNGAIRGQLSK